MNPPAPGDLPAADRRDLTRWALCFALVLALHGGAALALLSHSAEDEAAGLPTAIPIELAALPVAPSAAPVEDAAPGPEQTQSEAAPAEAVEAPPEPSPPETSPPPEPQQAAEAPAEEPAEEPSPEPATASVPDLKPAPKPEVALLAPPEAPKTEPQKPKPREKPVEKPKPRQKPAQREDRREEAAPARERPRIASAAATTAPASARSVAARAAAPMGNAGTSSSLPEWKVRLAAHLQRNKRYPSEAQASGQEGVATLQFTVDRAGRVTSSRLVRSSGVPALDAETLALIRRAQPLPPPPADVPGAQFSFSVPFRYSMR